LKDRIGSTTMAVMIPIVLLIASSGFNLYSWSTRFEQGYESGRSAGYAEGHEEGERIGFQNGNSTGYSSGYLIGNNDGLSVGYDSGYEAGEAFGLDSGYIKGKDEGYNNGFVTGNETGFDMGFSEGYDDGYVEGVSDGAGRGWTVRDPTYSEAMKFISKDRTDLNTYDQDEYNCFHFTATVKSNSFDAGYRCFLVYIRFPDSAHAIVAFNTTDRGVTFIEPQDDQVVRLRVGHAYWDRSEYLPPDYDDTVVSYTLVP